MADHTLQSLADRMADAARELQHRRSPQETMETAASLAVRNVDSCQAASISIVRGHRNIETPAGTSDAVRAADRLQAETGEGPCIDALYDQTTVYVRDLTTDDRWPTWGTKVSDETGLHSVLSCQLFTDEDTVGALNMYSERVGGFDGEDRAEGLALAAHIAVAVAAAQQVQGLVRAKGSESLIGQAMGIAMERFDIDADQAWALLTRLSQSMNIKVRVLAEELIKTRTLPTPPDPR